MNLQFGTPYHNKTIAQCRAIGARGGRRSAMNRRVRRPARIPVPVAASEETVAETARQAIALLDAQFPWLRGCELRTTRRAAA